MYLVEPAERRELVELRLAGRVRRRRERRHAGAAGSSVQQRGRRGLIAAAPEPRADDGPVPAAAHGAAAGLDQNPRRPTDCPVRRRGDRCGHARSLECLGTETARRVSGGDPRTLGGRAARGGMPVGPDAGKKSRWDGGLDLDALMMRSSLPSLGCVDVARWSHSHSYPGARPRFHLASRAVQSSNQRKAIAARRSKRGGDPRARQLGRTSGGRSGGPPHSSPPATMLWTLAAVLAVLPGALGAQLKLHHRVFHPSIPDPQWSPRGTLSLSPGAPAIADAPEYRADLAAFAGAIREALGVHEDVFEVFYQLALERPGDAGPRDYDVSSVRAVRRACASLLTRKLTRPASATWTTRRPSCSSSTSPPRAPRTRSTTSSRRSRRTGAARPRSRPEQTPRLLRRSTSASARTRPCARRGPRRPSSEPRPSHGGRVLTRRAGRCCASRRR
jgi:hypothetical protein